MAARRVLLWAMGIVLLLGTGLALLGYVASRSDTVLRWGIERFASRLPCQLALEGLRGAITEPLHIARVSCENADYRVEGRDVLLDWSPWLLTQRRLDISMLRMASLSYRGKRTAAGPGETRPPDNLGLPISVRAATIEIDSLSIERANAAPLLLSNLRAAYEADARKHALALHGLVSEWGKVRGDLSIGANSPFVLQARLQVNSARLEQWPVDAVVRLSGSLARLGVKVEGQAGPLPFSAAAELAPFELEPVKALQARSDAVNLAAFDQRLPATALVVELSAQPHGLESLTGTLSVLNPQPGPADDQHLPLKTLQSQFRLSAQELALRDATFDLGAAGEASGQVVLGQGRLQLDVNVRRLDLRQLYATLRATQLAGTLRVEGGQARQRVAVNLREADLRIEGEAQIGDGRLRIERLLARTGGAQASASGHVELDDTLAFALKGDLRRFDPARFGDFPKADISGTVQAHGALRPQWRASVTYRLARSRYLGQPLEGQGTLTIAPGRVRDVDARLTLGPNTARLRGSFGVSGDAMQFDVRAPVLAVFERGISGALQGSGTLSGTQSQPALDARFTAARIAYRAYRVETWTGELRLEQGEDPQLALRWKLAGVKSGQHVLDRLNVSADGTLSAHHIEFAAQGENIDASAQLQGGFRRDTATWRGRLVHFENASEYAFALLQPAALELAADHVLFGATRVRVLNTDITLGETVYRNGELASSGSTSGVRLSPLLALLERPPKLDTTLVFGARWSLQAGEKLDATLDVAREGGDIVMRGEEPLALGLKQAVFSLRAVSNRIDAELAVSGDRLEVQASAQTKAQRRAAGWGIAGDAPLKLDARAELKSIRALIALLAGNALVGDGSLQLRVQADGTVAEPRLAGTLA
ncbi:MAG: hypothetical protein ABI580_11965, partial [Burkholderiaceae bacterium]